MLEHQIISPLPYSSVIDQITGKIHISTHTALVTAATIILQKQNPNSQVYIAGENTFGKNLPSTAKLMKDQMIKKGVSEGKITAVGNLNNTKSQLRNIKRNTDGKVIIVDLAFHDSRVNILMSQLGMDYETELTTGLRPWVL